MQTTRTTRNAEATKDRILDAALAEFSAHGIAGARVDRIAGAAKCNKNLIYIYFEDKDTLFNTVICKHISRIHQEQPFTPGDLPAYAAKIFDWVLANPDLMRLLAWSALEQTPAANAERCAMRDKKIAALAEAQLAGQVGPAFPSAFLLIAVMSLATAWSVASPFAPLLDREQVAAMRKSLTEAVRLLASAGKGNRTRKRGS